MPRGLGASWSDGIIHKTVASLFQLCCSLTVNRMTNAHIPSGLWPHFQEYDPRRLDREQDADLTMQRTLEYSTWEEIRWLGAAYGRRRLREYVRLRGERQLSPATFTFWRKLLSLRRWQHALFAGEARQVWPF